MKIALLGNPNSGKTTLFNLLTGMNAKIGNWPGVTIEKKTGIIKDTNYEITDLPGIYSLSPYSSEEKISTEFILKEKPDVIINIVDATCLSRSLYLTTQLLELDCKVIIALNMVDALENKGIKIDINKLKKELSAEIFEISALKKTGIKELVEGIKKSSANKKIFIFSSDIEIGIMQIEKSLGVRKNKRFLAVKNLEEDERFKNLNTNGIVKQVKNKYNLDLEEQIATERYNFIDRVKRKAVYQKKKILDFTEILDGIFLNKFISIPIFICIMFGIYFLSVGVVGKYTGDYILKFIDDFSNNLEIILKNIHISESIISLITDGIIKGVGTVISFIPQLIILFFCISILESTGYMSRIAFLLDRIFRKFGLSGKALIPFIIGSGCSVPGIMGTRIIENEDERKMTCTLVPFIPCSAKVPIIALFAGYFFKDKAGIISGSIYVLSIIIVIISASLMKKYIFKNMTSCFVAELPNYKIPSLKNLIKDVWDKVKSFIKKAGTTILACSIIIWFLLSFSLDLKYGINIENSILAEIGKKISFIFYPIVGVNSWEVAVAAMQGLIAKEQVISSMAIISGLNDGTDELFGTNSVFGFFTQASAYAFIVFNLFSAPCINAIIAMRRELKSFKNVIKVIVLQTFLAWVIACIVYNIEKFF